MKSSEGVIKWVSENQSLILTAMKVGGAILGSVAAFHALRLGFALLASPVISMYKGFLNIQKAITLMRNSTVLATVASKAQAFAMGACCLQKLGRDQGEGCRAVEFVLLELPEYRFGREGKLCDCRWCRQKRLGRLLEPDRLREKRLYRTVVCGLGER